MKHNNSRLLLAGLATLVALSACGGSSRDTTPIAAPDPAPTAQVPATANYSVIGFIGYLNALLQSAADTLEPVSLSTVTPPTDDTLEPSPLN